MYKALIFDFDGVITDTEPLHMEAWQDVLDPLGISFDEEEYHKEYMGLNDRDFLDAVGRIHGHYFDDQNKANLIETKLVSTLNLLEHNIPLLPGVADFIENSRNNYMLSICSGATRAEIEYILKKLKWLRYFEPIITSDSVKKGKPDPEGYIRAFEGLADLTSAELTTDEAIAIEDSPRGIVAAKKAGLKCLALSNSYPGEELKKADWIFDSLNEVVISQL